MYQRPTVSLISDVPRPIKQQTDLFEDEEETREMIEESRNQTEGGVS
jgi:hypothetical protein